MTSFRAGRYQRDKLKALRPLAPVQSVNALNDITPEELVAAGKKLVLVDVDNTLVEWRSNEIPESTQRWLEAIKSAGLQVCIISNTKKVERLKRLAGQMGIPFLQGRFKPSRRMFKQALSQFGLPKESAIMIGDQLFTDILGANRTGIDAIWVKQMAPKDFVGTKISRVGERIVRRRLHKVMQIDEEAIEEIGEAMPVGGSGAVELLRLPAVQQFVKFCVVGGTSTVIDIGLFWFLRFSFHEGLSRPVGGFLVGHAAWLFQNFKTPADAAVPLFKAISTLVAMVNSFLWNRKWTFQIHGKEHRRTQLQKFFVISIIGLLLNTGITTVASEALTGTAQGRTGVGLAIATVVVAFWNFFGQKYWIFKRRH